MYLLYKSLLKEKNRLTIGATITILDPLNPLLLAEARRELLTPEENLKIHAL